MDKDTVEDIPNMAHMVDKGFNSLPDIPPPVPKTTPQRPKHSTINLLNQPLIRDTLDSILSIELEGATIDHNNFIDEIFTDEALGFKIAPIVHYLTKMQAFERSEVTPEPPLPNTLPIHYRRNVASEAHTTDHLNKIITLIENHIGKTSTRQWSPVSHNRPMHGGVHPRKPDIVLYDKAIPEDTLTWKSVHSVCEVTGNCRSRDPYATLRSKALSLFSTQHSRRYVITAWMTQANFGATLFDRSGEIKGRWSYTCHETYVRLIAGLAYGSEELLGYDLSLERDTLGAVNGLRMNNERYSVLNVIFSSDVLRGRATICWLVMKDGKQRVVKDTWVDDQRQYKECGFLDACAQHEIENVPTLICTEELVVNGKPDSTISRRPLALRNGIENRVHCRLLLDPICTSIQCFRSQRELLHVFIDCIKGIFKLFQSFVLRRYICIL